MAELVKVRRLSDEEGQRLLRIVRRGEPKMTKSVIRYRRALVVLTSASGKTVPAIAGVVAADEDTVRAVITGSSSWAWGSCTLAGRVAVPAGSSLRTRSSWS